MKTTYLIDKIRRIAIWSNGATYYQIEIGYSFIDKLQKCSDSILFQGDIYPVEIVGDEISPILCSQYADFNEGCRVILPNTIKRIADNAFSDTTFSELIQLPESLLEIGNKAFLESGIKKVIIPRNVIFIGKNAFPAEMEVECLSPFLIRTENNSFSPKWFSTDDGLFMFRITNPISKEVSIIKLLKHPGSELIIPTSINLYDENYWVTGLDSGFIDSIYEITKSFDEIISLPAKLRKIGNSPDFSNPPFDLNLPETTQYIGKGAIFDGILKNGQFMHLPKKLRFIGDDNFLLEENTTDSPNINIHERLILDDESHPIYYFGNKKAKRIVNLNDEEEYNGGIVRSVDYDFYYDIVNLDSSTF